MLSLTPELCCESDWASPLLIVLEQCVRICWIMLLMCSGSSFCFTLGLDLDLMPILIWNGNLIIGKDHTSALSILIQFERKETISIHVNAVSMVILVCSLPHPAI